jgi:hypothetical protein
MDPLDLERPAGSFGRQLGLLTSRYVKLITRDRRNLAIMLGQVPVIGLLIAALFAGGVFTAQDRANDAANLVFLLVTVAVWFGAVAGSREIVKELGVLRREHAVGLRLSAYLGSKFVLLMSIAAAQAVALGMLVLLIHEPGASGAGALTLLAILAAGGALAVLLGLIVSTLSSTEDQATSFIPLALIPQLLLGGAIVSIPSMSPALSALAGTTLTRWLFASGGSSMDMHGRIGSDEVFSQVNKYGDFFTTRAAEAVTVGGLFLLFFTVALAGLLAHRLAAAGAPGRSSR